MIFTGFSALLLGPLWDFERIEVMGLINTIRRNMCLLKKVLNKRNDKNKRSSADQEQKWHNQQYIYKFEEVAWPTWRSMAPSVAPSTTNKTPKSVVQQQG